MSERFSYDPEHPRYSDQPEPAPGDYAAGGTPPAADAGQEEDFAPQAAVPGEETSAWPESEASPGQPAGRSTTSDPVATVLREAGKLVDNISQSIGASLQGRGNVVMVRVNDEALRHLDMLVEAEVTKSRSEAAALLINEGIRANQDLFDRISEITGRIQTLRDELRRSVRRDTPDVPDTPELIDEP